MVPWIGGIVIPKITVTLGEALDLTFGALQNRIIGQGRWTTTTEYVVQHPEDKKFYQFILTDGSTENNGDIEDLNDDEIELIEVQQVDKVVKVWEVIP